MAMDAVMEWVRAAERGGGVCQRYMRRLAAARDKASLFRVICDVNGGTWLFEEHSRGVRMPVVEFRDGYMRYLSRKVEYSEGYSSKMFVRDHGIAVDADTTLLWLLECRGVVVVVPRNSFPTVALSDGSSAHFRVNDGARLDIVLYGDAEYTAEGFTDMIRVERK